MHRDQGFAQLAEHRHRDRAAANVRPRATVRADGTTEQQDTVVEFGACLDGSCRRRTVGLDGKATLDDRAAAVRAHQADIGATTEEQTETGDDHRLAGAGLSGDDGEAG